MQNTNRAMYVLEAMNGPLDGKRWKFETQIVIGRDASTAQAALPLDRAVSRRHARIEASPEGLCVLDLGSSNGTLVRGQPIADVARISPDEPFVVGQTMLRVMLAAARMADNPSAP